MLLQQHKDRDDFGRMVCHNTPLQNFWGGDWRPALSEQVFAVPDPLGDGTMFLTPRSSNTDVGSSLKSLEGSWANWDGCTDSMIMPEQWSKILYKWADLLEVHEEEMSDLIRGVFPVEESEAEAEIALTLRAMRSWTGNNIRYAKGGLSHTGTAGHRATTIFRPYGTCGLITPFNFPLEIVALQIIGALVMGNTLLIKPHELVGAVTQAFLELGLQAGLPPESFVLMHGFGSEVDDVGSDPRLCHGVFTGSTGVFNLLGSHWLGETSGIGPAVYGPLNNLSEAQWFTVRKRAIDDRWLRSGQVCARRAIEFVPRHMAEPFNDELRNRVAGRSLADLNISPVLTWSNKRLNGRVEQLQELGGHVLFGGKTIESPYVMPKDTEGLPRSFDYGCYEPTLVQFGAGQLADRQVVAALHQECFGPVHVQVVYDDSQLSKVMGFIQNIPRDFRLTAACVTNDSAFVHRHRRAFNGFGVFYHGIDAGTKGAPDWMRFAPGGSRAACIGGRPVDVVGTWAWPQEDCFRPGPIN